MPEGPLIYGRYNAQDIRNVPYNYGHHVNRSTVNKRTVSVNIQNRSVYLRRSTDGSNGKIRHCTERSVHFEHCTFRIYNGPSGKDAAGIFSVNIGKWVSVTEDDNTKCKSHHTALLSERPNATASQDSGHITVADWLPNWPKSPTQRKLAQFGWTLVNLWSLCQLTVRSRKLVTNLTDVNWSASE